MPTLNPYPRSGYPFSRAELRKLSGIGTLYHMLNKRLATTDTFFFLDDFALVASGALTTNLWTVANSGGTGVVNFAAPATTIEDGAARGATGTTSGGSLSLIGPTIFFGSRNCGMEIRWKVDVVTSYNVEVGLIDAVPATNGSGVSNVDTPTANMTDGALLAIDTNNTLKTLAFVTAGTTFTTTATTLSPAAGAAYGTPAAATYNTTRIEVIGNEAFCWHNGILQASHTGSKVDGTKKLAPWVYARTRNTVAKQVDIDYIALWKDRN